MIDVMNPYWLVLMFRSLINIVIVGSSLYVAVRANTLYSLSSYKGFKIFRNAFTFFMLAFIFDFILFLSNSGYVVIEIGWLFSLFLFLFYFFITGASFYLVYSLVWKEFEKHMSFLKKDIFSNKDLLLVGDALIVSLLALFWKSDVLFIVSIAVLGYAIVLSYQNYQSSSKGNNYPQLYFISIVLAFIGYVLNYLVWFFPVLKVYVLLLTAFIFIVFLYGVIRASRKIL